MTFSENLNFAILKIQGLPKRYLKDSSKLNEDRFNTIKDKLLSAIKDKKTSVVYIYETAQPIYKILKSEVSPSDIAGIDFEAYFDSYIKQNSTVDLPNAKFVFIYNIGLEKALKKEFSERLLKGLIKRYEDNDSWVFLEGYVPYKTFTDNYNITVANTLNIPLQEQETIF
jgi:hypothetical protein